MNTSHALRILPFLVLATLLTACAANQTAEPDGPPQPGTLAYDQSVFHAMLEQHDKLRRSVTELPDGVETLTESDDPAIAARLFDHVSAMKSRLETGRRIRQWDPLYVAVFDNHDKIRLDVEQTPKGIRVRETSTDPKVVAIIHSHAKVVSGFVARGFEETAEEHPVPATAATK